MAFQTAFRPRPVRNERPPTPIVPIERVRPIVRPVAEVVEIKPVAPAPKPATPKPLTVDAGDLAKWEEAAAAPAFSANRIANETLASIAAAHGVTADEIRSSTRKTRIVKARWEAMAAIYTAFPDWSLPKIGRFFGGRDHTTVLHAVQKMGAWRQ